MKVYPNSKPWVSKSLKSLLQEKKRAFREGNSTQLRELQNEIKCEIKAGNNKYKDKIKTPLRMNNLGTAWDSRKTILGLKESRRYNIILR